MCAPAQAQVKMAPAPDLLVSGLTNDLDLIEIYDSNQIDLSRKASVYVDKARNMTTSTVLDRFARGDRPRTPLPGFIASHDRSSPLWIVVPIINRTANDQWGLDLGNRLQGRSVHFTGVFLYEHAGRRLMVNAVPSGKVKPSTPIVLPEGTRLPLTLPQHKPALVVLYLIPDRTGQVATPLVLMPDVSSSAAPTFWQNPLVLGGTAALSMGVLAGFALLSRRRSLLLVAAYPVVLVLPLLIGFENAFLPVDSLIPSLLPVLSLLQGMFLLLAVTATARQSGLPMVTPFLPMLALALHLLAIPVFFMQPTLVGTWGPFLFAWLAVVTSLAISLHQVRQGDAAGIYLAGVCVLHLTGTLCVWLAQEQIVTTALPVLLNATGWIIPLQATLFGMALQILQLGAGHLSSNGEQDRPHRSTQDEAQLAKLRQAKEGFDYNNLLKVIEHERKQLSDARERESLRTEEMRRAKEAADEANRAKSAFLAVISHEIRTPMTGVMGMVKMLLDSTLSKEQHDYVTTIKESGNAMMALLNDILDFEKIESGKMQLEQIDFDLPRLIQSTATLMNGHATSKGLYLKIELDDNVPRYVIGDMSRLRQVLLNLVGNAIKFTRQGGITIRLSASQKPQEGNEKPQHQIYFAVQDTGIGISRDGQKNIFNPFAQADKSIARKFGGSGLGLAISRRLIETMGSQININSREGEGTTFFFTLTLPEGSADLAQESAAVVPAPLPTTTTVERNHYRMLVVDDNEITQRVIRALLEQHGHQVSVCGSGEEALALLGTGATFDAILSDVQMHGMSGHEFSRRVRQMSDPLQAATPIIALTGNVDKSDIQMCYDAGMNDHLAKPVDPDRFNEMLNNITTGTFRNPSTHVRSPMDHQTPGALTSADPLPAALYSSTPSIGPEQDLPAPDDKGHPVEAAPDDSFAVALANDTIRPSEPTVDIPFQPDMLDTLRESLGVDQLTDMLKSLFDKADELIGLLEGLSQPPYNFSDIRARAHELKGMCGNFGLMSLSQLAAQIEKKAKSNDESDIAALINELPTRYAQGRQAIDNWLKS